MLLYITYSSIPRYCIFIYLFGKQQS